MKTVWVVAIPLVFLVALIFGAMKFGGILHQNTQCVLGSCPLELRDSDSGKTFIYSPTMRFTVFFNERLNPEANLRCSPDGVIGRISNTPPAAPPLYAATFEGVAPGTCTLLDDVFSATIIIQ
jgi:hypothetical protein